MKDKCGIFLVCIGFILLAMLLFPPFRSTGGPFTFNDGYSFFLSPPNDTGSSVNVELLFVQWLFVATIGVIGWYLLRGKR